MSSVRSAVLNVNNA